MSMFSPPSGGAAGKVGIRYEDLWTVLQMLEILDGKYDSITLEPYGETGEGVEFYLKQDDVRIYHQVKRQAPNKGWTVNALESVLETFGSKLQEEDTRCVFVSGDRAHELSTLTDRADRFPSVDEFDAFKASLTNEEDRQEFERLANEIWEVNEEQAHRWLARIGVEEIPEPVLLDLTTTRADVLIDGPPSDVRRRLKEIANNRLLETLTEHDIWHALRHGEEVSYEPRAIRDNPEIQRALQEANELYLSSLRQKSIFSDELIGRDEANEAFELLTDENGPKLVTMTGEAGIGKSFAVMQVADRLGEEGIPFFSFRVDRIGDNVNTPKQIGEHFDLSESPVSVLAGLSQEDERCVLIIDQLDAVSLASGRSTHLFDCIDQLIQEASAHPNLSILVGCREFDRQNDQRIRQLTKGDLGSGAAVSTNSIPVTPLTESDVKEVVERLGVDITSLSDEEIDLLSIPLHLRLFREIIELRAEEEGVPLDFDFGSLKELYDRYWDEKRRFVANEYNDVRWAETLGSLSEQLSEEKKLSLPQARLDPEFERDREILVSENVLVVDENRVTFFHETFFDYVFAHFFLASGQHLPDFILNGEQALFLRAPVRQILIHLREADFDSYLNQIEDVLYNDSVRFHIRQVVLAILGKVRQPTENEWEVVAPLLEDPESPEFGWLKGILSNSRWFDLLDELDCLEEWLGSGQSHLEELAIDLLYNLRDDRPQRFAELLSPYVERCRSEKWRDRFRQLMRFADFSAPPIQDLTEQLVSEGFYHDLAIRKDPEAFWDIFRERKDQQLPSDTACRLTASYLIVFLRGLKNGTFSLDEEEEVLRLWHHPAFSGLRSSRAKALREAAEREPAEWLQTLLPVILRFVEAFADESEDPPIRDSAWLLHSLQFDHTVESLLIGGTIDAMETAETTVQEVIDQLEEQESYQTVRFLLVHAYRAAGQECADEAVDFLLECADRDGVAWVGGDRWAVSELIEEVAPHCSSERYEALEKSILNHHLRLETAEDQRSFGRNQHLLLDALPDQRLSEAARRRKLMWERKFGDVPDSPPGGTEGGFVGPPSSIAEGNVEEMSDSDWVGAIQTYDAKENPDGELLSGGGRQLAQVLRSEAEKDPERLSKLAEKLPDDALTTYFNHLLWGVAEGDPDLEDVMRVVQRCHDLPERPCGRFITMPMEKHSSLDYDENIVEIIRYYALEDASPDAEKSNGTENSRGLLNEGINTVRGTTATAIAALIRADESRTDWFWPILEEMVNDPSLSVRACVAQALLAASNRDEERAVNLFLQLCEINEHRLLPKSFTDRFLPYRFRCFAHWLQSLARPIMGFPKEAKVQLLASRFVERFFYYKLRHFFDDLQPLLCRMLNSSIGEVAQTGALHACLASLSDERATPMAEKSLAGSVPHRKGAAEVYANNLLIDEHEETCKEILPQLFDDPEEEVRNEAARCFSTLMQEGEPPGQHTDLIEAFIQSAAITSSGQQFFMYLDDVIEVPPTLAESLGERFLALGENDPSISHRSNAVGKHVIRAYSQSRDEDAKQRLLDLIDRFVQRRHHGVLNTLSEFERTHNFR